MWNVTWGWRALSIGAIKSLAHLIMCVYTQTCSNVFVSIQMLWLKICGVFQLNKSWYSYWCGKYYLRSIFMYSVRNWGFTIGLHSDNLIHPTTYNLIELYLLSNFYRDTLAWLASIMLAHMALIIGAAQLRSTFFIYLERFYICWYLVRDHHLFLIIRIRIVAPWWYCKLFRGVCFRYLIIFW